jgi:hypothetical protein
MRIDKTRLTYAAVAFTILSFVTGYFVKPHPSVFEALWPAGSGVPKPAQARLLANRIARSYDEALILTRNPFTAPTDATSLEALRNWASKSFARDPNFLHPSSIEEDYAGSQSVIDSYAFSILASIRFAFEGLTAKFLAARIAAYHQTDSYRFFALDYMGLFGNDSEARQLLLQYESSRALDTIDPLLIALLWLVLCVIAVWYCVKAKSTRPSKRLQNVLAGGWLGLAIYYIIFASVQNQVSVFLAGIICSVVGLYLSCPVSAKYSEKTGISLEPIALSTPVVTLLGWLSISLLIIRLVCWIKTGSLSHPDPITLIVSGLKGDFLHDPVHVKRNLDRIFGLFWLCLTLWILPRLSGEWTAEAAQEEPLRAIQKPLY